MAAEPERHPDMEMFESVPCPLCGGGDYRVLLPARYPASFGPQELARCYSASNDTELLDQLVRCAACGLVYLNPRPRPELILAGYAQAVDPTFVRQNQMRVQSFKRALAPLARRLGLRPGPGQEMLDIGCAGGAFPQAGKELGFAVSGVEPSRWLSQYARDTYGVQVHTGTIFDQDLPAGHYQALTFWDVLEHLTDPGAALARARELLGDDGLLILTYPDYGSLPARLLGRRWPFLLSVHLTYYTRATISAHLVRQGFAPVLIQPYWQTLELGYVLQRAGAYFSLFTALGRLAQGLGGQGIPLRYYLGQTLVAARKRP